MARISKPGLDYFPLDVNFLQDRKVRRISCRHHAAGIAALTSLLCLIYKEKGYYILWNKDTLFDIAQEACCGEEEMQAIIDDCLAVGLFDDLIYKEYGVLTSHAIQEQYHKIITDSRRKYKLPLEHFWLIKEDFKDVTESHDFATTMPQTKEETDTDIKGKQEMDMENESKSEIKKDKETERQGKCPKENERIMPPVPSNSVFQASPVVVEGLSLDKSIGKETVSEGMQAGVAALSEHGGDLLHGGRVLHRHDVHSGRQDVPGLQVAELDGGADQLALVLVQTSLVLRLGYHGD